MKITKLQRIQKYMYVILVIFEEKTLSRIHRSRNILAFLVIYSNYRISNFILKQFFEELNI